MIKSQFYTDSRSTSEHAHMPYLSSYSSEVHSAMLMLNTAIFKLNSGHRAENAVWQYFKYKVLAARESASQLPQLSEQWSDVPG